MLGIGAWRIDRSLQPHRVEIVPKHPRERCEELDQIVLIALDPLVTLGVRRSLIERREVIVIDPPRVHDLLVFVEQEINRVQRLDVRGVQAIPSRLHQRVKEIHPGPAQFSAGFEKLLDLDGQNWAEEHRGDHDPLGGIHARAPPFCRVHTRRQRSSP